MKVLFSSDIHGNRETMEKLMRICIDGSFDRFVITGDLTGMFGGGSILEPVRNIITVSLGNCDNEAVIKSCKIPYFDDYGVFYVDGFNIFYTHGHIFNEYRLPPCIKSGDIFVSGHTHIPCIKEKNGIVFLNPGSASKPRGGFVPTYMVYENRNFEILDFDGNVINAFRV